MTAPERRASRLLFVDDEKDMVLLLKTALEEHAYEVITAMDGNEGLGKVVSESPDLVILDVKMPRMDGFEVLRRLKDKVETRFTPVIMVSGVHQSNSILRAKSLDAADYLSKPIQLENLLKAVERCI